MDGNGIKVARSFLTTVVVLVAAIALAVVGLVTRVLNVAEMHENLRQAPNQIIELLILIARLPVWVLVIGIVGALLIQGYHVWRVCQIMDRADQINKDSFTNLRTIHDLAQSMSLKLEQNDQLVRNGVNQLCHAIRVVSVADSLSGDAKHLAEKLEIAKFEDGTALLPPPLWEHEMKSIEELLEQFFESAAPAINGMHLHGIKHPGRRVDGGMMRNEKSSQERRYDNARRIFEETCAAMQSYRSELLTPMR